MSSLFEGMFSLGEYETAVRDRLARYGRERVVARIWAQDASLWSDKEAVQQKITNRLGWLATPLAMASRVEELDCVKEVPYEEAVLLGMGGSSLAPELFQRVFGNAPNHPRLHVLDNTNAAAVQGLRESLDLSQTLFMAASKSGTTVETRAFADYFLEQSGNAGKQFVAITDPGSALIDEAEEQDFAALFLNPQDIGGRYSALSFFGLVPAAAIGIDVTRLLARAREEIDRTNAALPPEQNIALTLGVTLGVLAAAGRDKLTLLTSPSLSAFGDWAEQLIAESTGKDGRGILPVVGERPTEAGNYGPDRLFVYLRLEGEGENDGLVEALESAGHPVVQMDLADRYDLGAHFFRWEFATAVAGVVLGVNPFDEPNVAESKDNTGALLQQFQAEGALPLPEAGMAPADIQATGEVMADTPEAALHAFVDAAMERDYFAITAYLPMTGEYQAALRDLQAAIRDRSGAATTMGFGPRYLHSTGQFHKGGPAQGRFIQIVTEATERVDVPGAPYDFATLAGAQALGDLEALQRRDYPVLRLLIRGNVSDRLSELAATLGP